MQAASTRLGSLRLGLLRHLRVQPRDSRASAMVSKDLSGLFLFHTRLMSEGAHGAHLDKQEVADRVLSVVKSFPKVDPGKVTPSSHFQKDLGLDSLDTVEVVMAIEEEFALEIPDNEADKIESCSLAIDYVASHSQAK